MNVVRQISQAVALYNLKPPVVHRDIKPANVLVAKGSLITKLCDMSLSKLKTEQSLSRSTAIAGSPSYIAPECVLQKKTSNNSIRCMVTAIYVIGTIYRTRLLGLRFVERKRKEACIGRELWRFFLRYPVFDGCHGEEKIASCVGIAFRNLFATDSYRLR